MSETAERQREGALEGLHDRKRDLGARTGFTFGFDSITQYLDADSDRTPSDAASNVTRFYGTWTVMGRGTPDSGAVVFKIENRTAIGDRLSTGALGPSLGYAGVFATAYSDAGLVLTNLYWRQRFSGGRGSFVIGQVDVSDYVSVNDLANPWTAFTNLAFEQQPTFAGPSQGLGAAMLWRLNDRWAILGGVADANGDPSDPLDSARKLFDSGETFKHFGIGWTPKWADRADESVQLTLWQVDKRKEAGSDGGSGVSLLASARLDAWRPFLRAGYADGADLSLDRAISAGAGYDARGGKDLVGLAAGWGRSPGSSRDQFSLEAFYRYDVTDFLQLTPEIQYVVNPSNDPETDDILVLGARFRVSF